MTDNTSGTTDNTSLIPTSLLQLEKIASLKEWISQVHKLPKKKCKGGIIRRLKAVAVLLENCHSRKALTAKQKKSLVKAIMTKTEPLWLRALLWCGLTELHPDLISAVPKQLIPYYPASEAPHRQQPCFSSWVAAVSKTPLVPLQPLQVSETDDIESNASKRAKSVQSDNEDIIPEEFLALRCILMTADLC